MRRKRASPSPPHLSRFKDAVRWIILWFFRKYRRSMSVLAYLHDNFLVHMLNQLRALAECTTTSNIEQWSKHVDRASKKEKIEILPTWLKKKLWWIDEFEEFFLWIEQPSFQSTFQFIIIFLEEEFFHLSNVCSMLYVNDCTSSKGYLIRKT